MLFRSLQEINLKKEDVREKRYAGIFHIVSAADGAEKAYTQNMKNNPARYETLEEARAVDKRLLAAVTGHDHLKIIPNYEIDKNGKRKVLSFKQKKKRFFQELFLALGIPAHLEIERKFLVALNVDFLLLPKEQAVTNIQQTYLKKIIPNVQRRVRMRTHDGNAMYIFTEKIPQRPGVRIEREEIIGLREYLTLLQERDPRRSIILKDRYSFVWAQQYFQLDNFHSPMPLTLLEIELPHEKTHIELPPFLKIIRDVTEDPRYSNSSIAKGICPGYKK